MTEFEKLIGRPALLEQLAEEASELTQAALKAARILRAENPTPVGLDAAMDHLREEYTDVIQCARCLCLTVDEEQIDQKRKRWLDRIEAVKYQE